MDYISVTGHRPDKLGGYNNPKAEERLNIFAKQVVISETKGPVTWVTGMAQGWDTAIAQACFDLGCAYIAVIPFVGQEKVWPVERQRYYEFLLSNAADLLIVSDKQEMSAFNRRNYRMVDMTRKTVALWDGTRGGTSNCVAYAKSKGHEVTNYFDHWIKF